MSAASDAQQQAEFWRQKLAKEGNQPPHHSFRPSSGGTFARCRLNSAPSRTPPQNFGKALWFSPYRSQTLKSAGVKRGSPVTPERPRPRTSDLRRATAGCRTMAVACEACSQAGRRTYATFGKRGEKRARFCGVCARYQPAATLVRAVAKCSACCTFIAETPAHMPPPPRPNEPRYCGHCAVERCAVAYMPLTADDFKPLTVT